MREFKTPERSYDLSFCIPESGRGTPELVLTIPLARAKALEAYLRHEGLSARYKASEYFFGDVPFVWEDRPQGLFSWEPRFGFEGCGYYAATDNGFELHFPITRAVHALAFTIWIVLSLWSPLYAGPLTDGPASNREQVMSVEPFVRIGESMYGHPISGEVYPRMWKWLKELPNRDALAEEVTSALRAAWRAAGGEEAEEYDESCGVRFYDDGRFSLVCFGDACDVSIYPDQLHGGDDFPIHFSCHNLDQARQQITLLCGLARLHEIATKELDRT